MIIPQTRGEAEVHLRGLGPGFYWVECYTRDAATALFNLWWPDRGPWFAGARTQTVVYVEVTDEGHVGVYSDEYESRRHVLPVGYPRGFPSALLWF